MQGNIFSAEELTINEKKKAQLVELISSGEAFLMAGAGLTIMQGYPLWKPFIQSLEKKVVDLDATFEVRKSEATEADIVYSTRLIKSLGNRFYDIINDVYGAEKGYHKCHASLIGLPFKGILTTNYDRVLEQAIRSKYPAADAIEVIIDGGLSRKEVYKFLRLINTTRAIIPKVVHLHGECRHPNSIIFSAEHYEAAYGIEINGSPENSNYKQIIDRNWTLHRKLIWALMATRRIVYFGFSMTDEYFRIMHQIVGEDFRFFGTDTHFLVTRIGSGQNIEMVLKNADRFKEEFGIETIFFEDDEQYKGLENFIFELERIINPALESLPIPIYETSGDKKLTAKLFDTARKQFRNED